jgi:hypothetical protein
LRLFCDGRRVPEARKTCLQPEGAEIVHVDGDAGTQFLRGWFLLVVRGNSSRHDFNGVTLRLSDNIG